LPPPQNSNNKASMFILDNDAELLEPSFDYDGKKYSIDLDNHRDSESLNLSFINGSIIENQQSVTENERHFSFEEYMNGDLFRVGGPFSQGEE